MFISYIHTSADRLGILNACQIMFLLRIIFLFFPTCILALPGSHPSERLKIVQLLKAIRILSLVLPYDKYPHVKYTQEWRSL